MTLVLRVLSGGRAGHVLTTDASSVRAGRAPDAELRFEPNHDIVVSAHHATFRVDDGRVRLIDESRNGTWVNGVRITGAHEVRDGDRIVFGAGGPEVELRVLDAAATRAFAAAVPANEPASTAATAARRGRPVATLAVGVVILALLAATSWVWLRAQRERSEWERQRSEMHARIDSAVSAGERTIGALEGEMEELAAALRESQQQVRDAAAALERAQRSGDTRSLPVLRSRLEGAMVDLSQRQRAADLDHAAVRDVNARAVARVYAQTADGETVTGTAFAVRTNAVLVTSRHVVAPGGRPAVRVAVQFGYSDQVWPARVVALGDADDVALIRAEGIIGDVPIVRGLNLRSDTMAAGAPLTTIGFPLGGEAMPSDRAGRTIVRPVAAAGVLRARPARTFEFLGYGTTGSSGSPVFDRDGGVLGIVFGGKNEAGDHYVVAVPALAFVKLLETLSPR